jgi:hypothetical protein
LVDMRRSFCLSLLIVIGFVSHCVGEQLASNPSKPILEPYTDADGYSIYGILLKGIRHSLFVIQSETESEGHRPMPEDGQIKRDRNFYRVWEPVLNDYAKQFQTAKLLTRSIPTSAPYVLVPRESIEALFKSALWNEFYERYPSSGGYYWFSAVGFDPHKTRAIVDMGWLCGPFCGGGQPHFFEKTDGKWREVKVNADIPSWVS